MNNFDNNLAAGWQKNFPPVMRFVEPKNPNTALEDRPWGIMTNHQDYKAAKSQGDRDAAARLVHTFLKKPENQKQLALLKAKFQDAIIVPVCAEESNRKNRIPEALAEYISMHTGIEIDETIVQTNKVHRTGSSALFRLAFRAQFDGTVQPGRNYIIIDDVFTFGGTLNDLRLHIEKSGGSVVQAAAMALGGHGENLAMRETTKIALLDRHGENNLNSFLKEINLYDGNYKNLTDPEACLLGMVASLDQTRDRILAERRVGESRVLQESIQRNEPQTITVTSGLTPKRTPTKPSGGRHF